MHMSGLDIVLSFGAKLKGNPIQIGLVIPHQCCLITALILRPYVDCVHHAYVTESTSSKQSSCSQQAHLICFYYRDRRHCNIHALHYVEPQAGIFVSVAVVVKETELFGGVGGEVRKSVYCKVVRRFSEELRIRGK